MGKIITFAQIMLPLMSEAGHRLFQNDVLEATFGGGEANVAVSLANFGEDVAFVTALPENAVGQAAINAVRSFGVDTTGIVRTGERVGIYFAEKGQSQRPSKVIYDRKNSAIAGADPRMFDWDKIFDGADWFHFTGITPALSETMKAAIKEACAAAKAHGLCVSCDLNYRKKLWSTQEAYATMSGLMQYVDVCIANEEDAEKVLGIQADGSDVTNGTLSREGYRQVAKEIADRYGCRAVAITLRSSRSASDNDWAAMLYVDGSCYISSAYQIHIWDRVGGGDSFCAGLIYGLHHHMPPQKTVDFAAAASCLKHTIQGDFNRVSLEEVTLLMNGDGSGRVQR